MSLKEVSVLLGLAYNITLNAVRSEIYSTLDYLP